MYCHYKLLLVYMFIQARGLFQTTSRTTSDYKPHYKVRMRSRASREVDALVPRVRQSSEALKGMLEAEVLLAVVHLDGDRVLAVHLGLQATRTAAGRAVQPQDRQRMGCGTSRPHYDDVLREKKNVVCILLHERSSDFSPPSATKIRRI